MPQMCRGSSSACRKPSENRTQLYPRRARPPPSRAPPHPPPGEAAAPCRRACVPRPACGPGAGVASPRCRDSHARSCVWRPRVAAQVRYEWEEKELQRWRRSFHGRPGSLYLICAVEQGWRPPPLAKMVQVITAQECGREHMSKTLQSDYSTLQSGRAVAP